MRLGSAAATATPTTTAAAPRATPSHARAARTRHATPRRPSPPPQEARRQPERVVRSGTTTARSQRNADSARGTFPGTGAALGLHPSKAARDRAGHPQETREKNDRG